MALVPSPLLRAQRRLGLSPTQLAVLMQLCDFWWDSERKPYPSKATLAERLGLSPRQVQLMWRNSKPLGSCDARNDGSVTAARRRTHTISAVW